MGAHTQPDAFDGDALLHTDWFPTNVLVPGDGVRVVDWAWASRGAAWIDAALWAVWLRLAVHTVMPAAAPRQPASPQSPRAQGSRTCTREQLPRAAMTAWSGCGKRRLGTGATQLLR
ncbi:hypothetical protein [Nocardia sp. NPDC058666]|uniref:hypothetical protein n=1 Tax=Actinomycetes TaxID=1760 RepID=UPI0036543DE8